MACFLHCVQVGSSSFFADSLPSLHSSIGHQATAPILPALLIASPVAHCKKIFSAVFLSLSFFCKVPRPSLTIRTGPRSQICIFYQYTGTRSVFAFFCTYFLMCITLCVPGGGCQPPPGQAVAGGCFGAAHSYLVAFPRTRHASA